MIYNKRLYKREECLVFMRTDNELGGLSNMSSKSPLVINGVKIRTPEALYQTCRFPEYPDVQREIISQPTPMEAKIRAVRKDLKDLVRRDWKNVRVDIMRWVLRVRLIQNKNNFGTLLDLTGESPIVKESNIGDDFWGAVNTNIGLYGVNMLGRLLLELRLEYRERNHRLSPVFPPQIPYFLFLGEKISPIE